MWDFETPCCLCLRWPPVSNFEPALIKKRRKGTKFVPLEDISRSHFTACYSQ